MVSSVIGAYHLGYVRKPGSTATSVSFGRPITQRDATHTPHWNIHWKFFVFCESIVSSWTSIHTPLFKISGISSGFLALPSPHFPGLMSPSPLRPLAYRNLYPALSEQSVLLFCLLSGLQGCKLPHSLTTYTWLWLTLPLSSLHSSSIPLPDWICLYFSTLPSFYLYSTIPTSLAFSFSLANFLGRRPAVMIGWGHWEDKHHSCFSGMFSILPWWKIFDGGVLCLSLWI